MTENKVIVGWRTRTNNRYRHLLSGVRKITQSEQNKWCNPVSNYVMPVPAGMI